MNTSQTILSLLFATIVALASTNAAADNAEGLMTGHTHQVRVIRQASMGIEAAMPHRSAYGRALELDRQGKYQQAYLLFRQAAREFQALQRKHPHNRQIRTWIMKAHQQRSLSYSLYRMRRYVNRYYRYRPYQSVYRLFNEAINAHLKWLAIRAFGLRPPKKLADDAIRSYRRALKLRAGYTIARLRLAALYAELHDRTRAQALATPPIASRLSTNEKLAAASYFAVTGDPDKALALISSVVRTNRWRRQRVFLSNFFDTLRGDPRFSALVAPKPRP